MSPGTEIFTTLEAILPWPCPTFHSGWVLFNVQRVFPLLKTHPGPTHFPVDLGGSQWVIEACWVFNPNFPGSPCKPSPVCSPHLVPCQTSGESMTVKWHSGTRRNTARVSVPWERARVGEGRGFAHTPLTGVPGAAAASQNPGVLTPRTARESSRERRSETTASPRLCLNYCLLTLIKWG